MRILFFLYTSFGMFWIHVEKKGQLVYFCYFKYSIIIIKIKQENKADL